MEKKTREHTFQISGVKDRIVFLAILALLGGSDVIEILIPGMGVDPKTIIRIENEQKTLHAKSDNIHEDLMHEIEILDAKIDDTTATCMGYRREDAYQMESLRHKVGQLNLLINQCLERTQ